MSGEAGRGQAEVRSGQAEVWSGQAEVRSGLEGVEPVPSALTVGFFDGVHRGHQDIVARTVRAAASGGLRAVALTFDRHPAEVLRPEAAPRYLMTAERRVATLAALGLDLVVVLPFTHARSQQSPEAFVREVVVGALGTRRVVVGENFRFGHRAAGDLALLRVLGAEHGFEVEGVGLRTLRGQPLSSTEIRARLDAGDVCWAHEALGRPHVVEGSVERGVGRGRSIGIPTANLAVDGRLQVPARGVYAGWAQIGADPAGARHAAVMNVGVRPTFGGGEPTVEAHLLDTERDLYGHRLALLFAHRLRAERRFSGVEELTSQIRRDITEARRLLDS